MEEFEIKRGNFIKDNNSTSNIYLNITACLLIISIYGIISFSIREKLFFRSILLLIIPIAVCVLTEFIWYLVKKNKKSIIVLFKDNYSYLLGLILGLSVPITTSYILLIVVAIIITLLKLFMGGFYKNNINPIILGLIIILIFTYLPINIDYSNFKIGLLFSNYSNTLGSISPLLLLLSFLYLIIKKAIKGVIPITSIITIIVLGIGYSLLNNISIMYPVIKLISSTLLFNLIFIASDNVTTPLTKKSQIILGFIFGILVFALGKFNNIFDSIVISLLILSFINILLKKLEIKYNFNK